MLFKNVFGDAPATLKGEDDNPEEWGFQGHGAAFGNLDRVGDVIAPGAFDKAIPWFKDNGIIANQHRWFEPIGAPIEAYQDGKGLFLDASIAPTALGKDVRTLMQKKVLKTLSIGYDVEEAEPWSVDLLRKTIGEQQFASLTAPQLEKTLLWGRLIKTIFPLYEVSPVSIAANGEAGITGVKGIFDESVDNPFGLRAGLKLQDNEEAVRATVIECSKLAKRWVDLAMQCEKKEGRPLSEARRARLRSMVDCIHEAHGSLKGVATDLEGLLAETAPEDNEGKSLITDTEADALLNQHIAIQAKLYGLNYSTSRSN